jgi:hypothetical protein
LCAPVSAVASGCPLFDNRWNRQKLLNNSGAIALRGKVIADGGAPVFKKVGGIEAFEVVEHDELLF